MGIGLENPSHWLLLALIAVLLFGPKRLPEIGRSLGGGIRDFRTALQGRDQPPIDGAGESTHLPSRTEQ